GETIGMHDLICRGKFGLDGLFKCIKHFIVKRRVSEGLFEGKLICSILRSLGEYSPYNVKSLVPADPRRK
ncbi:hypothetical protein CPC08DRAFT_715843, partial [Agrocybe pediades]